MLINIYYWVLMRLVSKMFPDTKKKRRRNLNIFWVGSGRWDGGITYSDYIFKIEKLKLYF